MSIHLIKVGDRFTLPLDPGLVEALGLDDTTQVDIAIVGDVIVVSPHRAGNSNARTRDAVGEINRLFGGVFRRLTD